MQPFLELIDHQETLPKTSGKRSSTSSIVTKMMLKNPKQFNSKLFSTAAAPQVKDRDVVFTVSEQIIKMVC